MIVNTPNVLTGDIRIDALLADQRDSMALNHAIGTAATITYSFNGYTAAQVAAVSDMLNEISSVAGITFKQVAQGGLLTYNWYTVGPKTADGSDASGYMKLGATDAGVYLNATMGIFQQLDSGLGRQINLHETLHALGFKHPGHYSDADSGPLLPAELAKASNTVMAYANGYNSHLGEFDILVLQYLYGPSGNTKQAVTNVTNVNSGGSLFDDTFKLDVKALGTSVRIEGGAGRDELHINVASKDVTVVGANHFTYQKEGGGFAGVYLDSVERIHFTDKSLAFDVTGHSAQAYRLYEAAFNRKPDLGGLGYWINELDKGVSLDAVSQGFISSTEFKGLYGATHPNDTFITALYQNILGRAPDQGGFNYWSNQLQTGTLNEAQVLASFSESNENKIALSGVIQNGVEYLPA